MQFYGMVEEKDQTWEWTAFGPHSLFPAWTLLLSERGSQTASEGAHSHLPKREDPLRVRSCNVHSLFVFFCSSSSSSSSSRSSTTVANSSRSGERKAGAATMTASTTTTTA